jgi:hypothetical protein
MALCLTLSVGAHWNAGATGPEQRHQSKRNQRRRARHFERILLRAHREIQKPSSRFIAGKPIVQLGFAMGAEVALGDGTVVVVS